MKIRKILLLIMLINLLLCVFAACSKEVTEDALEIFSYDTLEKENIVIENDKLEFHFNPETTQFHVIKKSTGYRWDSNPQELEQDTIAQGSIKKELNSTITIRYNTESGSPTAMNNFNSSIEKGNYTYEVLENGIKVNYTIADLQKVYIIPVAVPESRWKEFFDKMERNTQQQLLNNYKIYDINKLSKNDNKEELLETFPDLESERIFVLRDNTQEYLKKRAEEFFAEVGYTHEDYDLDSARYELTSTHNKPIFNVSIRYELVGDTLLVSIPMNEIQFKKRYPIVEVRPLPYFGAGSIKDNGFIFVPEGSGGIINFNNGKNSQREYISDVYGWDYGIKRTSLIDETRANMPIFGISNNTSAFLCLLEDGNSYAQIEADIAGRMHSYNYVTARYTLIHNELMDISAKSDKTVRMFQEELPDETITQRYVFIDNNDYISMAETYREYLLEQNPELTKRTESDLPVAVEIIGAIDRTKHFFGVPTRRPYRLTSYRETKDITKQLLDIGITDLSIKYNGWFNEGILHKAPTKVKLISELGNKRDFENMVSFMNENKVKLYLESSFQFVYSNKLGDGFLGIRDTAKHVNRKLVELYPYNPIYFGEAKYLPRYYLAKPRYYMKNVDTYANEIAKLGVKNIAFGDFGKTLGADYDPKASVSRDAVKNLQAEKMKELHSKGYGMMISSGGIYAVPYADFIVDMNLSTKGYNIIDEEIPFYQIAIHGLVSYAGQAINLAGDYERNILKSIETGAGLYFVFMEADSFSIQDSRYTRYFSSEFSKWSATVADLYGRMKKDFGHLYNQFIVDHQKLAQGVTMTQYEDGTKVIVNHNEYSYTLNGKEIPAKDYIVEGGKQ